ncbi:MAG: ribokinase [Phycisphaerae bacterium]
MKTLVPTIAVVGSINMDLVVRVPHVPAPGETVVGGDLARYPGGKGANQAVAAARLGAKTIMIGRVGDDANGRALLDALAADGVDTTHVRVCDDAPTGAATIAVSDDGENAICVAPGANARVTPADVDAAERALRDCHVCLLQLELPVEPIVHAIRRCREWNVKTILDYAPAPADPPPELLQADVISPNAAEAAVLAGRSEHAEKMCSSADAVASLADAVCSRGASCVVLKLGAAGALICNDRGTQRIPPFTIEAVDTTAAGDAFTAALGVALAEGQSLAEAARFANAAGALACTVHGAQPSMPARDYVVALLAESPEN